jgi:hypothetical protein
MSLLGNIGLGVSVGGLLGSVLGSGNQPSYDYSGYQKALDLINQQQANVNTYYQQAGQSLESQYGQMYGTTMQNAVNASAAKGIYNSPVSQVGLNRTTSQLANVYANAQANLQGQKLEAQNGIDSQMASYYTNLANTQYQTQMGQYQNQQSTFGAIGGLAGGALAAIL